MAQIKLATESLAVAFVFLIASTYWRVEEHVAHALISVLLISVLISHRPRFVMNVPQLVPLGFFVAFLGWLSISVFWSPNFALSANYALLVVLGAVNAIMLGAVFQPRTIASGIVLGTLMISVHGATNALFVPQLTFLETSFGNFTNPSSLSLVIGAALVLVPFLPGHDFFSLVLKTVVGGLFIYMLSELIILTSLFAVFAALCVGVLSWHIRRLEQSTRTRAYVLYLGLASFIVTLLWFLRAPLLALIGEDANLSERVPLWGLFFEALMWRPVGGAGWGNTVGWDFPLDPSRLYPVNDFFPAHNGFLDTGLMLGLIGVIGLVSTIIAIYARSIRISTIYDGRADLTVIPVLLTYLVVNDIMATSFPRYIGFFFLGLMVGVLTTNRNRMELCSHKHPTPME